MKALIVAGEASGDLHAGALAVALQQRLPGIRISAIGGSSLQNSGAQLLTHHNDLSVVGIFEVASKLPQIRRAFSGVTAWIKENKPDFAVLTDYPDFNFRLARFLKKQHVKTFYFISPQIWAWRKGRVHFLRRHIDLMISILPFEEEFYKQTGVPVVYVGHPLVDIVNEQLTRQKPYPALQRPLIGIMPGSREVEVRRHLPVLNETLNALKKKRPFSAVLIWPPWLNRTSFPIPFDVDVVTEDRYAAMHACDLMFVASGTSTVEAAILNTPLFIVYRVGGFSWQLGKLLVRVPYYGLVNWIAHERCIPEFIQNDMDAQLISTEAVRFLDDPQRQQQMKDQLKSIVSRLGPPGAIDRAADCIISRL